MTSPFLGMNPYLERESVWSDFHLGFLVVAKAWLNSQMPAEYFARLHVLQPALNQVPIRYLEVFEQKTESPVTVIELLRPSDKGAGNDREVYLRRRDRHLVRFAHFIEIDLLRGGARMPWRGLPAFDYCVVVSRVEKRPEAEVWPFGVRDPFPRIPVPLNAGDLDVTLDLKAILDRVYDESCYENSIYDHSPEPLLRPEDDEWARQFIAI